MESFTIRVARLLAIIAVWSVAAAMVMGYFFSPIGAMAEPTFNDVIAFGARSRSPAPWRRRSRWCWEVSGRGPWKSRWPSG